MIGICLLILFISLGIVISLLILDKEYLHINIWIGSILGLALFMWLPLLFSFKYGFGYRSHFLAAFTALLALITAVIKYIKEPHSFLYARKALVLYLMAVLPVVILISVLLTSHVLKPLSDGSLAVGQSTFGDLPLHLSIITSIAQQGKFPPDYSIFPGQRLCYPFLVDSLSSSLLLFGVPLRFSILIPSFILIFLLVSGFYFTSAEFLKSYKARIIAIILFFINGGFGIIYFLDGLKTDKKQFLKMFTEFYKTPTNYWDKNIKWVNIICDMIIPQRTTLAGWAFVILCLWLVYRALKFNRKSYFMLAGLIAGAMPMIHTHSYFAVGIIAGTWFFTYLIGQAYKVFYVKNWMYFGIPALVLSVPQLLYWTFNQSSSEGFVKVHFNWANNNDIWIWFWIKNVGIVFLLLIPALIHASTEMKKVYTGFAVLFVISEIIVFQPNIYDNNKLFYIWYLFTVIITADFIDKIHISFENRIAANIILIIIMLTGSISGSLSICREYISSYVLFDRASVSSIDFIRNKTLSDGIFLTSDNHNNVTSSLCGRYIFSGSPSYLAYHGIDYGKREAVVDQIFRSPETSGQLLLDNGIDYILISSYEKGKYQINKELFDRLYKKVFEFESITVYAVSHRALQFLEST